MNCIFFFCGQRFVGGFLNSFLFFLGLTPLWYNNTIVVNLEEATEMRHAISRAKLLARFLSDVIFNLKSILLQLCSVYFYFNFFHECAILYVCNIFAHATIPQNLDYTTLRRTNTINLLCGHQRLYIM